MLQHITDTLPPTLHLPISPEDTLYFYRYLCTHILIEDKRFLLLIDIPIQDRACQITIHQVFTLDIPYGDYSARYDINTRYFRVTKDATMGLELSTAQFQTFQQANGQFCHISTPFQPLANAPTCIAALYTKSKASITSKCSLQLHKTTTTTLPTQITPDVWIFTTPAMAPVNTITLICPEKPMETIAICQPLQVLKLPTVCSATSAHFYLPPRYEAPVLNANVSLDIANLQMVNITTLHFCIWQHLGNNHSDTQLQHLVTIPSILCTKFINISSIALYNWPLLIWNHQKIWILYGACSPTQEYMFQLWNCSYQQELDYSVAISFGANLPDYHADLYNQVTCNIQ